MAAQALLTIIGCSPLQYMPRSNVLAQTLLGLAHLRQRLTLRAIVRNLSSVHTFKFKYLIDLGTELQCLLKVIDILIDNIELIIS